MTQIIFLPHPQICPDGAILEAHSGDNLIEVALAHGIELEHACEMSCACTTCHVLVREGLGSLAEADELEDDLLDKAWGLEAASRLSCQIEVGDEDLVIEIPKYTLNQVSEAN